MTPKQKVLLIIMDGWGISPPDKFNAIDNANTPNFDFLKTNFGYTEIPSSGEAVGLPPGNMGTSEVNHTVIGTGRIGGAPLGDIFGQINSNTLGDAEVLKQTIEHVRKNNTKLHLFGILSNGGVHSHILHLIWLLDHLESIGFEQEVLIHAFTDGRDTPPQSARGFFEELEKSLATKPFAKLASLQGRFYLDRDRDWDKTNIAVDLVSDANGKLVTNWQEALEHAYQTTDNDQYIEQYKLLDYDNFIGNGDAVFGFNFRADRLFQICKVLGELHQTGKQDVLLSSFIKPGEELNMLGILGTPKIPGTLSEMLSQAGKRQLHITETEKYPHLTYYFNGRNEQEFTGETWELKKSNKFVKPYYNVEPSMRDFEICEHIVHNLTNFDFVVANFSNTDMVGHTGNYNAAVIAAESIDFCLGKLYQSIKHDLQNTALIITADHGNSDQMWDYQNNVPHTQHTLTPVPFILATAETQNHQLTKIPDSLTNVAPTILKLFGMEKGDQMVGESYI